MENDYVTDPKGWAEMVQLRIGMPNYTPDDRKLYPIYLLRQGEKMETKHVTPEAAAGIAKALINIFERGSR